MSFKLAIATDDNYVLGTLVLLQSSLEVIQSTRAETEIFFLEGGHLSARAKNLLETFASREAISLKLVQVEDPGVGSKRHISPTTLSKFEVLRRVDGLTVWLDVDMVLTRDGLRRVVSELDLMSPEKLLVASRPGSSTWKFNAGLFGAKSAFRVDWRPLIDDSRPSFEQHIFQESFRGKTHQIDSSFNVMSLWGGRHDLGEVMHYVGPIKPWHFLQQFAKAECVSQKCAWSQWYLSLEDLQGKHEDIVREASSLIQPPKGLRFGAAVIVRILAKLDSPTAWVSVATSKVIKFLLVVTKKLTGLNPQTCHPIH